MIHIFYPDIIPIDFSPMRMIRLLSYMGRVFSGMGMMLSALTISIKRLAEVFTILMIFFTFFICIGIHLFKDLHFNKCMNPSMGSFQDDVVRITFITRAGLAAVFTHASKMKYASNRFPLYKLPPISIQLSGLSLRC